MGLGRFCILALSVFVQDAVKRLLNHNSALSALPQKTQCSTMTLFKRATGSSVIASIYSVMSHVNLILITDLTLGAEKIVIKTYSQAIVFNTSQRQFAITYNTKQYPTIATRSLPIATQFLITAVWLPAAATRSLATTMPLQAAATQSLTTALQSLPTTTHSLHTTHPAQLKASRQALSSKYTASIISDPPLIPSL